MNTTNTPHSWDSGRWTKFLPKSLVSLIGMTTVSNALPTPLPEPTFHGQNIEETGRNQTSEPPILPWESPVNQTQQRVADVLNVTAENPEKKIIEMLNQARKERIMLDKIQDDFFELCHQHYLGESVIISWNPQANIQPIKRFLARIGTSVRELESLCWVKR